MNMGAFKVYQKRKPAWLKNSASFQKIWVKSLGLLEDKYNEII